jgi:hypothetical protein
MKQVYEWAGVSRQARYQHHKRAESRRQKEALIIGQVQQIRQVKTPEVAIKDHESMVITARLIMAFALLANRGCHICQPLLFHLKEAKLMIQDGQLQR